MPKLTPPPGSTIGPSVGEALQRIAASGEAAASVALDGETVPVLPSKHGRGVRRVPGEMNDTERAYADYLNVRKQAGEIIGWWFEPVTWKLARRTTYTPDFMVMLSSEEIEFVDVKGFMEDDAAVKIKVAAAMFPFRFVLVKKRGKGWDVKEVKV